MRARLLIAIGTAALVATAAIPSQAATPKTLDGKKVKKLTMTANGGAQDGGDPELANLNPPNRLACKAPRCARLDFLFKPAKGVKGNLVFRIKWTNPASDLDLFVGDSKNNEKASCGGSGGTGEMISVPMSKFKYGQKYTLVADFFRSVNETVTATVEFPSTAKNSTNVPSLPVVDTDLGTNCSLDGTK